MNNIVTLKLNHVEAECLASHLQDIAKRIGRNELGHSTLETDLPNGDENDKPYRKIKIISNMTENIIIVELED